MNAKKTIVLSLWMISMWSVQAQNYIFKDKMSREVLESYLSRAITMQGLTDQIFCKPGVPCAGYDTAAYRANIAMLENVDAHFIGRTCGIWGSESLIAWGYFKYVSTMVQDIRTLYESKAKVQPIIQAGMFEYVSDNVNKVQFNKQTSLVYNEPIRNFNFKAMAYADFPSNKAHQTSWSSSNEVVPDISKKETQMWFYFLATSYIDCGIEALHFGNLSAMDVSDSNHVHYWDLLTKIRSYARSKNRGVVLCDAHTLGAYYNDNQLLFDFHSAPIRIKEVPRVNWGMQNGGACVIDYDYCNAIYKKSKGGTTYFGWTCSSLPYLVEFDNYGLIAHRLSKSGSTCYPWGFDEISWFGNQSEKYRNKWLIYASNRVKKLDSNAYLEMPGMRNIYKNANDTRCYQANNERDRQDAVIKAIWEGVYVNTAVKVKSNK